MAINTAAVAAYMALPFYGSAVGPQREACSLQLLLAHQRELANLTTAALNDAALLYTTVHIPVQAL
jgi:hypothetical protein